MSNDKLAEALERTARHRAATEGIDPDQWRVVLFKWEALALQAHAAEAAQAQAPNDYTGLVKALRAQRQIDEDGTEVGVSRQACDEAADVIESLAAAPQQAAKPVGYVSADILKTFGKGDLSSIRLWRSSDDFVGPVVEVYTHPQPAQDAALYQELLMAVSKKFPNESRHETALRYIKQTELQSCEPKCDAAMAKESGR